MKRLTIVASVLSLMTMSACAQLNWKKVEKEAGKTGKQIEKEAQKVYDDITGKPKPLSNDEVIRGLKEALSVGTNKSVSKVSAVGGYLNNPTIKIPWPQDAMKIKNTVDQLGLQNQTNKVIETMNRAAEEAAKDAAPIFLNAITGMSITDGFAILKGADNAATTYLMDKTSAELKLKFKPVVQSAIDKVELTKHWNPVITAYNKVPGVQKMNPDLNDYVTTKAMEGLFKMIADEEFKIRKDPVARVTDLLKRVFGVK